MKELYEIIVDLKHKVERLEKRVKTLENSVNDEPTLFKTERKKFIPPTVEEVRAYFKTNGYSIEAANKAHKYYNEGEWVDGGGKQIRNWKQKMVAVWFKDEYRVKKQPNHAPPVPTDYGKLSPTATPMPEHLKKRLTNIGNHETT